jgi:hypothetical protein
MRDLKWSSAEMAITRKAFDRALGRELGVVTLEAKSKAAKIQDRSNLWELEQYLSSRSSSQRRFPKEQAHVSDGFGLQSASSPLVLILSSYAAQSQGRRLLLFAREVPFLALSSEHRDHFSSFFRFSLKQEMRSSDELY